MQFLLKQTWCFCLQTKHLELKFQLNILQFVLELYVSGIHFGGFAYFVAKQQVK